MSKKKQHIVVTGPESCGKTEMVQYLSNKFDAHIVNEVAREYIEERGNKYEHADLRKMAFLQFSNQLSGLNSDNKVVISDTSMLDFLIWDEYKYGYIDETILEWYYLEQVDYYLLMYPDLPWVSDPLRENKSNRFELFDLFYDKIIKSNIPYSIIKGIGNNRYQNGYEPINSMLHNIQV